jgi:two-component system OmpR family response regulator
MDATTASRFAVVIDDDADIRQLLVDVLTQAGYQVIPAGNGLDGIAAVRQFDPVVTTLDVNMPGMDGFETAKRIRSFSSTYLVMLTALEEEIDTLQGLEAGADDYLVKPFRPRVLRAKIDAMLRRPRTPATGAAATGGMPTGGIPTGGLPTGGIAVEAPPTLLPAPVLALAQEPQPAVGGAVLVRSDTPPAGRHSSGLLVDTPSELAAPAPAAGPDPQQTGWMEHRGLWLNVETRIVRVHRKEVELTRSEFDLLTALLQSNRRVRTKPDLALLLRGESYVTSHLISEADKRAIEVHMGNLRKKLADNVNSPTWIETVRGVGYRLTASDGE